ncbi:hypothetical protein Back11_43550 [Paenibacillus baekrokdamisoli]|uniref:Uncharacterized protein n=1 Tax=Paenibacillus baekrokdamisoli TaxID=1712516 RepID=A0A3G9IVZ5_9BACL|nr:hypothetical protein [Paenibacillus baekrokdamisoli]MBB3067943.1 phage/plasmid-associated DNA primase [Paenibacillus baekrokdamisoli]BBH23010.1 hypothetical protein Back11_43550 [Paenibacillus baekrokdamisoli]
MPHPANVLIDDLLLKQLPGILNFSLFGLRHLKDNGYVFTPSKAADEILGSYKEEINPVETFVEEIIVKGTPADRVLHKNIGEAFRAWCRKEGHNSLSQYTQNRLIQNTKDILKMKGITTDAVRSNTADNATTEPHYGFGLIHQAEAKKWAIVNVTF